MSLQCLSATALQSEKHRTLTSASTARREKHSEADGNQSAVPSKLHSTAHQQSSDSFRVGGHGLLFTLSARVAGFLLEYNPRPRYRIRRSVKRSKAGVRAG